jgi:UDP-N-acetylmuramoyl-tripeptide--D-alanyl-D-alanine ligase
MAELGAESDHYHREIGRRAGELGVAAVLAVGESARAYLEEAGEVPVREWAPDAEKAASVVTEIVRPGDCVLVKGSRVVGLELVARALEEAFAE